MTREKLTKPGIRTVITGGAAIVAMLAGSAPVASAHQRHPGAPSPLPGRHGGPNHHHHHVAPGHGGHPAAPRE